MNVSVLIGFFFIDVNDFIIFKICIYLFTFSPKYSNKTANQIKRCYNVLQQVGQYFKIFILKIKYLQQ